MASNSSEAHFLVHPHENLHPWGDHVKWLSDRPEYPVIAVSAYLLMIKLVPIFMADRKPVYLTPILFAWNAGLAIFSIFTAIRMNTALVYLVSQDNAYHDMMCHNHPSNVTGYWFFLFAMSKFVEMGDTLWLMLRKKPVMFLHWYHHATVLVFTWISTVVDAPIGKFFALMNADVHSVMYSYYATQTLGIRFPRFVPITITCLQITQMVFGILILLQSYSMYGMSDCRCPGLVLITGAIIYGSYLALFVNFFIQSYFRGTKKGKSE